MTYLDLIEIAMSASHEVGIHRILSGDHRIG